MNKTVESIKGTVRAVVLPDDAEITGDKAHEWQWLRSLLREHGISVSVDTLRRLPYEIRLGPALDLRDFPKNAVGDGAM